MRNPFNKAGGEKPSSVEAEVRPTDNLVVTKPREIFSVSFINSVSVPGTQIAEDFTVNAKKQPGVELECDGMFIAISLKGKTSLIPLSNVRSISLKD